MAFGRLTAALKGFYNANVGNLISDAVSPAVLAQYGLSDLP